MSPFLPFAYLTLSFWLSRWHHVLKGKFLEGRRNRRLDHLIYILVVKVVPYYVKKQQRQELGFEGENLEMRRRKEVLVLGASISVDSITVSTFKTYQVTYLCNA